MIAIPNMSKPKSCEECPIRIGETVGVYYDSKSDEFKRVKITECNESKYHTKTLGEGYKMMYKDCPLVDIVTCGECVHWYSDADCGMACEFTNMKQPSDGFCNWGERRNDESNTERD